MSASGNSVTPGNVPFEQGLQTLEIVLGEMASLVAQSIHRSVLSLIERNADFAHQVLRLESRIDQMEIRIDELATNLIARERPKVGDLRVVITAIKINTELERMGRLAVHIVERSLPLMHEPYGVVDFARIANLAESMVLDSLEAFRQRDARKARAVVESDNKIDQLRDEIVQQMIAVIQSNGSNIRTAMDNIYIASSLQRIAEHANNVAEEVVFLTKGMETRTRHAGSN